MEQTPLSQEAMQTLRPGTQLERQSRLELVSPLRRPMTRDRINAIATRLERERSDVRPSSNADRWCNSACFNRVSSARSEILRKSLKLFHSAQHEQSKHFLCSLGSNNSREDWNLSVGSRVEGSPLIDRKWFSVGSESEVRLCREAVVPRN
jgi:hypothetical protein